MSRSVLVVDDDRILQSILQELLESEGFEVDIAANGQEALTKLDLQCHHYDTILLDLTMPYMDGLQLLREIKKGAQIEFSSIITLSTDERALLQAAHMGIAHAVMKPFDLEALLSLVACSAA